MATLNVYTVTYEVHTTAHTKEDADEKARMIVGAGNAKATVQLVGPARS